MLVRPTIGEIFRLEENVSKNISKYSNLIAKMKLNFAMVIRLNELCSNYAQTKFETFTSSSTNNGDL